MRVRYASHGKTSVIMSIFQNPDLEEMLESQFHSCKIEILYMNLILLYFNLQVLIQLICILCEIS